MKNPDLKCISKKLRNYIKQVILSEKTQKIVINLRKKLEIPEDGLPGPTKEDEWGVIKSISYYPESWKNKPHIHPIGNLQPRDSLLKGINKIIGKKPEFRTVYVCNVISKYIFHNKIIFDTDIAPIESLFPDLCMLENIERMIDERFGHPGGEKSFINHFVESSKEYPVILHIHKDATRNDILEYIKDKWSFIRNIQTSKDRTKSIPLVKTRVMLERDRYILDLSSNKLSRREVCRLVEKKFNQKLTLKHISVIRNRGKNNNNI